MLSCEHGGNAIPAAYRAQFAAARRALASHRGYDRGALRLARELSRALGAPLIAATVSRLVVDLNRSPHHPRLLSRYTRALDAGARNRLLASHYRPHRARLQARLRAALRGGGRVVHVSVHSFTPVLHGERRRAELGLLYDSARPAERAAAQRWQRGLQQALPGYRVRRNYPYRGSADGLTTALRERLPRRYLGLELELNQRLLSGDRWPAELSRALRATLTDLLDAL